MVMNNEMVRSTNVKIREGEELIEILLQDSNRICASISLTLKIQTRNQIGYVKKQLKCATILSQLFYYLWLSRISCTEMNIVQKSITDFSQEQRTAVIRIYLKKKSRMKRLK